MSNSEKQGNINQNLEKTRHWQARLDPKHDRAVGDVLGTPSQSSCWNHPSSSKTLRACLALEHGSWAAEEPKGKNQARQHGMRRAESWEPSARHAQP